MTVETLRLHRQHSPLGETVGRFRPDFPITFKAMVAIWTVLQVTLLALVMMRGGGGG